MAPRKEKLDKTTGEQGATMVLDYLRKQNRPYSATDVSANLHNRVSKAHAAKFLKEMHERKEIESKTSGKQVVYHCLQDPADAASTDDLADLDSIIADLRNRLADCKISERSLKTELSLLSSVISAADLHSTVEALQTQREGLSERLRQLKKIEVQPVSEAEKEAVEQSHKIWKKHASSRRRIFKDLWYKCVDHLPDGMVKEDLWEELGCEGPMM